MVQAAAALAAVVAGAQALAVAVLMLLGLLLLQSSSKVGRRLLRVGGGVPAVCRFWQTSFMQKALFRHELRVSRTLTVM